MKHCVSYFLSPSLSPLSLSVFQLSLADEQSEVTRNGFESKELQYLVQIYCQGRNWIVKRSYEDFRVLDKHLHLCIYDRRFSQLPELPRFDSLSDRAEAVSQMLMAYLSRLTAIADNKINCGPALTWMEVDNKGNHLLVHEESSINVPAIAAAHVIKRYIAQAADELSFEVTGRVDTHLYMHAHTLTWTYSTFRKYLDPFFHILLHYSFILKK
ncbi:unnamed protein product [Oncorhynchus mykiss]|uniref:PX domain-containing protein n=1 Tax=Oncorhynchus mykiss TaxID=8022 RepID=A0A060VYD3_ONCMY|nr:unnamed protein product [Oncorhynchus mykiss]